MKTKATNALAGTRYNVENAPAICGLIDFAAQNSGLEFANYGNHAAYGQEARSISADWRRVKSALMEAAAEGVTDEVIIAEAPHAFSGRLEWKSHKAIVSRMTDPAKFGGTHKGAVVKSEIDVWDWHYTTGQYFPTEYRKAVAALLEEATRKVRRSRPATKRLPGSIAELKALHEQNGGCWFKASAMRYFGTRIESGIIRGKYFVTSEQPPHGSRTYSLRSFDDEGTVSTVGEFGAHKTKLQAVAAIPALT